jgi:Ca-activated chloride channel family protein
MKALRVFALISACSLGVAAMLWAQGPLNPGGGGTTASKSKKSDTSGSQKEQELPPIPSEFKRSPNAPESAVTFQVDAITVTVDVAVVDDKGRFIPNIPQANFRILEDNVPQKITGFSMGEAPMTIAMVIEFSNRYQQYLSEPWYQTLTAAYQFVSMLRPDDLVAIVAYDLRPEILTDFTSNRNEIAMALQRMRIPAFSETNLFDAVTDVADRMTEIEGRRAIVLISTGVDTLSKLNYGEARKRVQNAGVPIYAVSLMQTYRDLLYQYGYISDLQRTEFLMADNILRTLAKESGGMSFFPRFYGEFPQVFNTIQQALRSQYVLTYSPTNQARDGKFRKIKVELVDPATNKALRITGPDGKNVKYEIIAKAGYTAPRPVE